MFLSIILMCYVYTLSLQPMKREEKRGERAWKECQNLRTLSAFLEVVIAINFLIWIWFPVPSLNWIVHPNIWVGITIFIVIAIFALTIMFVGWKDAGKETYQPSKESEMYGGIYNYIRHPQTIGEYSTLIALAFAINSLFIVIMAVIVTIIYLPIMIHYEEQDLIRRFGDKYREYQERTGAIFPKFRKSTK